MATPTRTPALASNCPSTMKPFISGTVATARAETFALLLGDIVPTS
jgi:hypothetical protein